MKLLKLNNIYNDGKSEYVDVEQITRIEETTVTKWNTVTVKKLFFNTKIECPQNFHGSFIAMKDRQQTYVLELPEQIVDLIKNQKYIIVK